VDIHTKNAAAAIDKPIAVTDATLNRRINRKVGGALNASATVARHTVGILKTAINTLKIRYVKERQWADASLLHRVKTVTVITSITISLVARPTVCPMSDTTSLANIVSRRINNAG
jgi:hypothetical protein